MIDSDWQLQKLPGHGAVAVSRGQARWTLVDEAHQSFVGGSLDDILVRAARSGGRSSDSRPVYTGVAGR